METPQTDVFERLVRIETKLDLSNGADTDRRRFEDERHADHENRIRRLERSAWLLAGAAAAVGAAGGSLLAPLIGGT
jgi:hypothetical protein